jgi:enoyl-CoA hydratase
MTIALVNVLYEKRCGIAYVTLNRPKVLNALDATTWMDLRTALEDAKADSSVRGVILTGAGDKAFIAGADISELAHVDVDEAEESSRFGKAPRLFWKSAHRNSTVARAIA